jgi:hypothetical protein
VMLVVQLAVAGLWTYSVVRWFDRGQPAAAVPSALFVAASVAWMLTFGRPRRLVPSSWDPEHTVVRVSARHEARTAILAGLLPVFFTLNALGGSRGDLTPVGVAMWSIFVLLMLLAILSLSGARTSELSLTADEVVLVVPRGVLGVVKRGRARGRVTGYRRRLGSLELLPWPLPGGARGRAAQEQRLVVPYQILARADVERALQLHGITSV